MSNPPLKVAIVGINIGCILHVRALRAAGFDVTMLVGRDIARTRERADHFGIPGATVSLDEALASDIDAIVIATPPLTHFDFTMRAIAAGKHVLCEKPFALDVGQTREMRDAAQKAGVVGQMVNEFRWFQHWAGVRHLVQTGVLGRLLHVNFVHDFPLIAAGTDDLPGWWLHAEQGGGWLQNYGSHAVDLIRYIAGEFSGLSAVMHDEPARGMSADDGYAVSFDLAEGARGMMGGSCRAWSRRNEMRVTGELATASIDAGVLTLTDANGTRTPELPEALLRSLWAGGDKPGQPEEALFEIDGVYNNAHSSDYGYPEQVALSRAFRNRILDHSWSDPAVATFDDGIKHVEIIAAVQESSRTGRRVVLPA